LVTKKEGGVNCFWTKRKEKKKGGEKGRKNKGEKRKEIEKRNCLVFRGPSIFNKKGGKGGGIHVEKKEAWGRDQQKDVLSYFRQKGGKGAVCKRIGN